MAPRHMKRCLTSLIIREMKMKTTASCLLTPARMAIIKKTSPNKCGQGCGENGTLLRLPYDPVIPPLGGVPKEKKTNKQ